MKKAKPGGGRVIGGESRSSAISVKELRDRISELERQNEALKFSAEQVDLVREQFSDLYDYAPVGYVTVDEKGVIHRVNLPAAAMLGGSRQEVTGSRLLSVLRPGDKTACAAFLKAAFSATGPTTFEASLLPGKWRTEHVQFIASPAAGGRDLGHAGAQVRLAILDVSERKRAAEALRESEHRFEAVVSAMAEGVVAHDASGAIVACNTAAERILDLTAEEICARTSVDPRWRAIHEDGSPFLGEDHPAMVVLRTGASQWNVTMGIHRLDGSLGWIRINAEPLRNADGSIRGAVATFDDITEERRRTEELRESEARLTRVLEGSTDGFWDIDVPSRRVSASARYREIFGLQPGTEDLSLDEIQASIFPEDKPPIQAEIAEMGTGSRNALTWEYRIRRPDGESRWILSRGKVLERASGGRPVRISGTVTDITERKQAEEALRASEGRLREVLDASNDGFWERDLVTGNVTHSARSNQIAGLPAVDTVVATDDWAGRVHPDDLRQLAPHLERFLAGDEERFDQAFRARVADGSWRWVRSRGKVTGRDPSGSPTRLAGTVTDIHDGMMASEALRQALFQLERHVNNTPLALVEWDGDYRVTRFGARAEAMFGWRAAEVVGKRIDEVPWVPEEDWPIVRAVMQAMDTGARPDTVSWNRNLRKDGAVIHCEWYNSSLYGPDGKLLSVFSLVQDVTARERAREALQESEARFRALADAAPVGIFEADASGGNVFLNPAGQRILGLTAEEARGNGWGPAIHPDDRERVFREWAEALATGGDFHSEYRCLPATGKLTWLNCFGSAIRGPSGSCLGYVGIMVDTTEQRALQGEIALSSRLAAMGRLVAGIAHEINNPLAAQLSDEGLALEVVREVRSDLDGDAPLDRLVESRRLGDVVEALEEAQESGRRIARIVKDMAVFANPSPVRNRVQLADVVKRALRWLPVSIGRTAKIQVEDGGAPEVMASPGQIAQVVENLISNAAKAVPKGLRDTIIVRIGPGTEGRARLEVIDHGVGIAPSEQDRIFDPFYTTRPVGEERGTGLGLAVCRSIVLAHGGTLTVESEIGKGSTFRVELPLAPDDPRGSCT